MKSKELILERIRKNKPENAALPQLDFPNRQDGDITQVYVDSLRKAGGNAELIENTTDLNELIKNRFPEGNEFYSIIPEIDINTIKYEDIQDPHELKNVDVGIFNGSFGVAENGAVWVEEKSLHHRIAPFICQHLVLIINRKDLVWNMHQAYENINFRNLDFGVFIAGPSKTADIEQSLVTGAHGPRSLLVIIKGDDKK